MSLSDQLCSDLHLCDISRLIAEWRDIAPALGLTEVEENTIMRDAYTQPAQRLAMLRIWKKKHGILATYRSLADAFTRCGRQDLVDIVTDLVRETSNTAAHDMITSNIYPSPSGTIQTTAISHNQFSSFSNQLSSRYPIPTTFLPYNPFPLYFLPVQQPVLPPTHPQAYLSSYLYTLQQWNDPTRAHLPSDFPSPPPNLVHLNQQYSALPSHTNTPILHQNPSLCYEPHPPPSLTDGPSPQCPRLDSPHLTSFTPTSTAVAHHSLAPPTPATTTLSPQLLNTTEKSQVTSYPPSPAIEHSFQQHSPLSWHPTPSYTPSPLLTTAKHSSASPSSPAATTPFGVTDSSSAPATPAHQHFSSSAMQQYLKHVKIYYNSKKTPVYDKESTLLHMDFKCKSFINIALVHKDSGVYRTDSDKKEMLMDRLHGHVDVIQKKKTKLRICDVCKCVDGRPAQCVLVEGAPGVGKTTLAFELCKQWARGEILQDWQFVVIIKLRDHRTRTAQNMYDLLLQYHHDPELRQTVVKELHQKDGKGMLLILDGYDELTDSQRKLDSVIQCLMSRELLCQSTLMVTSRPYATRTLHDNFVQSIDQHIEVMGFTEKNIEEYIQSACGDKPELVEDFKSYLSCHPFSSALMFNPLQCAIVTDLYRSRWECGDKGFAPKTLTELYTGLLHILLLRHLKQDPVYKDEVLEINDLSDLPQDVSQHLNTVTELAAEGIKNQQYVFDKKVRDKMLTKSLGLMQAEDKLTSGIGTSQSCYFLHLTLQEYLAAVKYSQQYTSPEQLSQLLTRNDFFPLYNFLQFYGMKREPTLDSSAAHWPVVLFVAGRTKLSGVPTNMFRAGFYDSEYYGITTVNVSLLHLLYETQSPQLIQSTLVTSRKYLSVSGSSALDWFVIGYCIANSTSTWRVEVDSNDNPKYFDQLVMGLRLGPEECSGECKIGSLHISGDWTGNVKILTHLQPYSKLVSKVNLVGNKQREQCDPEKSKRKSVSEKSAQYPVLEEFTIDYVDRCYSASLLTFISQHSNLRILSLNQCNLNSIATGSLIHFLQSPNNRLHVLTLDDCTIQIPDHVNSVAISYQMCSISPTDTENFSLEITGSLYAINYILSQSTLFYANTLTILKVVIVSGTTDSLQIETSFYPNLNMLDITSEGKIHTLLHDSVFHIILHQTTLHIMSLKRCNLTCDTVRSLIHSLQSSHCGLQELTLDDCISDHTHTTRTSKLKLKLLSSGNVSLEFTGYCCDISHWLSQLSSYTQLTELILHLAIRQDSKTAHILPEILLNHHMMLESLEIKSMFKRILSLPLYIPRFIELQQNNLCNLSLSMCILSSDVTRSLIHLLQSSHCRLHKLTIDHCTISTPMKTQQNTISTKNNTTLCLLVTTDSLCVLNHILSNVIFIQMTELNCIITCTHKVSEADVFTKIPISCPVLETIKIDSSVSLLHLSLPLSIPQIIGSQQNNIHALLLSRCNLSSDVTRSFIHSMQSLHCKLQNLTLKNCNISLPEDPQQITIFAKVKVALHSLDISWSVLNQMMSCINPFTQSLTELILHVDIETHTCTSEVERILQKIPSNCSLLETLKIDSYVRISFPLSIPQFIGSQQNLLHTLLLSNCFLSSDVTRSLIHSLLSPHCKLYKLALYLCTIPTADHTQLTTAIVSSTTITHLLFFDENIDSTSLTALASGLKHNTTIEQLAVDKYLMSLNEDQFQVLIDAVHSSAVKKLWLNNNYYKYKMWFNDCTLSRKNIDIKWHSYCYKLYNKW